MEYEQPCKRKHKHNGDGSQRKREHPVRTPHLYCDCGGPPGFRTRVGFLWWIQPNGEFYFRADFHATRLPPLFRQQA